jgi:hypothetical protein
VRLHHSVCRIAGIVLAAGFVSAGASAADIDIAGTWTWQWKDAQNVTHRHVLEVEGKGNKLAARERFDDLDPVKVTDLKVTGKKVTFSVLRGDRRSAYSGSLSGADTINGNVTVSVEGGDEAEYGWTATREPVKKK